MSSSLQTLIRDLHRRRGRERRGLALAEGVRLVEEALATAITFAGPPFLRRWKLPLAGRRSKPRCWRRESGSRR